MASLAQLPELVGFFSYSRQDNTDFRGSLFALRVEIQRELSALLAHRNFRLWQDQDAIDPGELWESKIKSAIEQSVFFIPIVTPRAVTSRHCKFEFESFLARERALGRNDLVFPIHYISVDGLLDETERRDDPVLSIVAERHYVDWRAYRRKPVDALDFGQEIEAFCGKIVKKLRAPCLSPDERRQLEAEARRRAEEEERIRLEAEAKRQAAEREKLRQEAVANKREEEARKREEVNKRAEEERVRQEPKGERQAAERERQSKQALAKNPARPRATIVTVVKRPIREPESRASTNLEPLTVAQERDLKPGDSFKEGADCPEMIVVPAGRFLMGSFEGQGSLSSLPQHEVTIAKPFAVAKFTLTFDEWDACAAHGGCRPNVNDQWGRGRLPAIGVNWDDAQSYVKWLSLITGKPYRLLSEAEHEYAARAGTRTTYPWGDDIKLNSKAMANCAGCGSQWDNKQTAPVGSFAPNKFGLYDMVGNVLEWTEDCWNDDYQGSPSDGSAWISGDCRQRVLRGGCWYISPHMLHSADRVAFRADWKDWSVGFRVARSLTT
jgi:formylglycine-generating enzyme required for sulfatase activity